MLEALISNLKPRPAHELGTGTMTGSGTGVYETPRKRNCAIGPVESAACAMSFTPAKVAVLALAGSMTTPRSRWWFCVRKTVTPASSSVSEGW